MKRTQQALRNILWGLIEKTITILCPFVIRTIIIYKLGNEYLGLSSLFSSILQVLSLAELGFGDAIIFGMYKPISEHDNKKVGTYLNTITGCCDFDYRFDGIAVCKKVNKWFISR